MTSLFRWKVAIFDDAPGHSEVQSLRSELLRLGVDCDAYGYADDSGAIVQHLSFLKNANILSSLRLCDVFLVDMDWATSATATDPIQLPDLSHCGPHVRLGVQAVAEAFDGLVPTLDTAYLLPPTPIPTKIRGFWVAAALSHVNSWARILFFSGYEDLIANPANPVVGLLSFKHPPVHVFKKQSVVNVKRSIVPFFENLWVLQDRLLRRNSDLYSWFVGAVVLPTLLGFDPVQGKCSGLAPDPSADAVFTVAARSQAGAPGFFPQWDEEWQPHETVLFKLLEFLHKEPHRLSSEQRRALASSRHTLRDILRRQAPPKLQELQTAQTAAYRVGSSGMALVVAISHAKTTRSLRDVESALSLSYQIESNGQAQLWDYCSELSSRFGPSTGKYECSPDVEVGPDVSRPLRERDATLPFDMEHFRRACEALIVNAQEHCKDDSTVAVRLSVMDAPRLLTITYEDTSFGFNDIRALAVAVEKSIKRAGLDRGLPLALSFGLFYTLEALDVKLKSGRWQRVFPAIGDAGDGSDSGFGVRWTFSQ